MKVVASPAWQSPARVLHSSFLLNSEGLEGLFLTFRSLQLMLQFPQFLFLLPLWLLKVLSGHISEILRARTTH